MELLEAPVSLKLCSEVLESLLEAFLAFTPKVRIDKLFNIAYNVIFVLRL